MKKTLFYLSFLTCLIFLSGISAVSAETVVSAPASLDGVLEVNSTDYAYNPETGLLTKTYMFTNISGDTLQNPKLVNLFLWSSDISSPDWAVMPFDAFSTYSNTDQSATVANNDGFIGWSAVVMPSTISSTALFPDLPVQTVQQDVSYPYWNVPGLPTQWPNAHPAMLSLQFDEVSNCNWIQNMLWVVYDVEIPDAPPTIDAGPFLAAWIWPVLPTDPDSPMVLTKDYSVLWTFNDDYASCDVDCTHTAEYQAVGESTWTALDVSTDESGRWYAQVDLPIEDENQMQNATTYALRFSVIDCADQTTESGLYYFRVAVTDDPPVIEKGPWLAAGGWPRLPTSESKAIVLNQNYDVLWTFSDDYASCPGLCTHRARYRKVGEEVWTWLTTPDTDPDGDWYAYVTLPIDSDSLAPGTYMFQFDVADCASQYTYPPHYYYFKVE
jgi:5-hydroxyisourate hydrolase-like protein (transthyretin family)